MSIKSKSSSIIDSIFGESKTYPIDFENLQTNNTNDYLKSNSIGSFGNTNSKSQNIPSLSVTSDIPKSTNNDLYKPSLSIPYSSNNSESYTPSSTTTSSASKFSSSSIPSYFFSYNLIIFFMIILLLLSFIGYNVFIFLYHGIEGFSEDFKKYVIYILNLIGYTQLSETSNNNNNNNENQQLKNINVNTVQGGIEKSTNKNEKIHEQNEANYLEDKQVNTNLKNKDTVSNNQNTDYEADDTMSNIQSKGKSGYCYIGEDRGFNSCVYVGPNDTCLSGDIFPSMDICVNPKLRS